jgi:homoserine acetyltransferase
MADPNWNNGFYYDGHPSHTGMKLARRMFLYSLFDSLLIVSYVPTPEPDITAPGYPRTPTLCPEFFIETYLDHQVRQTVATKSVNLMENFRDTKNK